jgi:ribonucleoside-diphosphate reductase subunit M2
MDVTTLKRELRSALAALDLYAGHGVSPPELASASSQSGSAVAAARSVSALASALATLDVQATPDTHSSAISSENGAPSAPCAPGAPCAPCASSAEAESAFNWADGEKTRESLLPIRHEDIWAFRKRIEGLHWVAQEVDLTRDAHDWTNRMTPDERHFVRLQLGFFVRADLDVLENVGKNFIEEVDCLEAKMVYAAVEDQECTHTESYNLQIEAIMSGAERAEVLAAVRTMPAVAAMQAWGRSWADRSVYGVGVRLVAHAAVEGIMFSSGFVSLQWLRERNLLPGITEFNTLIMRDEGTHVLFTCLLVRRYLRVRPPQKLVESIFRGAVDLVHRLAADSLRARLIGINADLLQQYIAFQADCVLAELGYAPMYGVANPLSFMDKLSLNGVAKTNFFESRGSQYQNVTRVGASRFLLDKTPIDG